MHGLPTSTDFSCFTDRRFEQVRIGKYGIELCFDGGVSISVEAAVSLGDDYREDLPEAGKELVSLLGCNVTKAERRGRGDLVLAFSNGRSVVIHDSNEEYESYTIVRPEGSIIV